MSHTPGPWYVVEDNDVWELYADRGPSHPFKLAKCPKRGSPYTEYCRRNLATLG